MGIDYYAPDKDTGPSADETFPVGDWDSSVAEAMAASKAQRDEGEPSLVPYIQRLDQLNVSDAIDCIAEESPVEQARFLQAERISQARKGVLGAFGVDAPPRVKGYR